MTKILVIDNEPGMRQIIDKILAPQGYEIVAAEDGVQAVAEFGSIAPDLVLLDVRLSDTDSAEVMEKLRALKPSLPIIILSGLGDADTAAELVKKGAYSYIHKPFPVDALRQIVKKSMNQQVPITVPPEETAVAAPADDAPAGPLAAAAAPLKRNKRFLVWGAGGALALGAVAVLGWLLLFRSLPAAAFPIAASSSAGIGFDGKQLWIADWANEAIYRYRRDKRFSLAATYGSLGMSPTGIAFDGSHVWVSDSFGQKIYKRNLDASLSVVASYPSPGASTSGLYYDGTNLWSLDFQQSKIRKHTMDATLSVVATYDSPAANPCGMFKRGGYFYIADASTNRIYKVNTADFALRGIYILPDNGKGHLTGIAWDGRSIWTCLDGVQKIFRCPLNKLKTVKL